MVVHMKLYYLVIPVYFSIVTSSEQEAVPGAVAVVGLNWI